MSSMPASTSPLCHHLRPSLGHSWSRSRDFGFWQDDLAAYIRVQESRLHALVAMPDVHRAFAQAAAQDRGRPLSGLLVGVKDIIHVKGFETRAGSLLPAALLQGPEASVVTRLKAGGAAILGKTATAEFAYFEPGPTHNPWHLGYTPGGSSSGSAAAVAAGLCDISLGTQTVGSVIRPAAFCGILGYKPSQGRVPRDGIIMFSESADHVGLLGRDWDTMLAAAAVTVDDWHPVPEPVQSARLGLVTGAYQHQAHPAMIRHVQDWCTALSRAGFAVAEVRMLDDIADLNDRHQDLTAHEFSRRHAAWFRQFAHLYRPRTAALIRKGQQVSQARYQACRDSCLQLRAQTMDRMAQAGVDLLISPAAVSSARYGLGNTGDPCMNLPWTHGGLPVTTMPLGLAPDDRQVPMPLGVQLTAGFGRDEFLLQVSRAIARHLPAFPQLLSS